MPLPTGETATPNLALIKFVSGYKGWGTDMNRNLDVIDAAVAALESAAPPPQVNSDWDASTGVASILNKPALQPVLGFTPENPANKGAVSGYPSLDATGHIPLAQLPASVQGAMYYVGVWNANTNSPLIVSGTGYQGSFYKVSVDGATVIDGNGTWHAGDMIIFDGAHWDKIDNYEAVTTVAGRTGAIVLAESDVTNLVSDLAAKAPSASPVFSGNVSVGQNGTSSNYLYFPNGAFTAYLYQDASNQLHINGGAAILFDSAMKLSALCPTGTTLTMHYGDFTLEKGAGINSWLKSSLQDLVLQPASGYALQLAPPISAATSGANASGGSLSIPGNYWNGAASAVDQWTIQNVLGAGANPTSTLTIGHTGSSGAGGIVLQPSGSGYITGGGNGFLGGITTGSISGLGNSPIAINSLTGYTVDINKTNGRAVNIGNLSAAGLSVVALAAPTGTPTGTPSTTGGTIPAGNLYANISAIDAAGNETAIGAQSAMVTTTGSTSSIVWNWTAVPGAVSYIIYLQTGTTFFNPAYYLTSTSNTATQTLPRTSYVQKTSVSIGMANSTGSVSFAGAITAQGLYLPTGAGQAGQATIQTLNIGNGYQYINGNSWGLTYAAYNQFNLISTFGLQWASTTAANGSGAKDVGLDRSAAGTLEINNGTIGNANGSLKVAKIIGTTLAVYANNDAAITGGLTAGAFYRTGADPDVVCVAH